MTAITKYTFITIIMLAGLLGSAGASPVKSSLARQVNTTTSPSETLAGSRRDASESAQPIYTPILTAYGSDFLDHFTAYTGADPTHGAVNYTDMAFASEQGYLGTAFNEDINATTAYIGMDHNSVASTARNSVRLSSKANFSAGSLFVIDVAHVPAAWGQWSSFWLLGQDGAWPSSGEIDIFESVHLSTYNTVTLHTEPGCSVANDSSAALGTIIQTDCNADNASDGCSTLAPSSTNIFDQTINTAGTPFNSQNGAVFVLEWTVSGIDLWMFSRNAVPGNLVSLNPSTQGFPTPIAHFAGSGCDYDTAFREMQLIIDVDACGDWAGQVWQSSGAAAATGVDTCAAYVENPANLMEEAYFEFVSLLVYSSNAAA